MHHWLFTAIRSGEHGYLIFENPLLPNNVDPIDGPTLGRLLTETGVPILVLNACRSAYAEAQPSPEPPDSEVHAQIRAFGSLAQEIIDTGVTGVVAMNYNLYVVTAVQFIENLYSFLAQGQELAEAVTLARKQLHAQPFREIAYQVMRFQDWPVPTVYEAAPLTLLSKPRERTIDITTVPKQYTQYFTVLS